MIVLGFTSHFDQYFQTREELFSEQAAALVVDGEVVSVIDAKRLLKMKTRRKVLSSLASVQFVLNDYGIKLKDIDKIALLGSGDYWKREDPIDIQGHIHNLFQEVFAVDIGDKGLFFVNHHVAYGMSVFPISGFKHCFFLTLHFSRDVSSLGILKGEENRLEPLDFFSIPTQRSQDFWGTDVLNSLANYRKKFGYKGLCITGNRVPPGSFEEKIRSAGIFDDIFVQLAEHAGGWAMGAALYLYYKEKSRDVPLKKKFEPFRNDTEKIVGQIWQELFSKENISIDDNFFELGGNSLTIMKVHGKLEELFAREIPVASLFRYPTIRELVQYLDCKEKGESITVSDDKIDRSLSVMEETRKIFFGDENE
jgi:predicted NodU family carbamoyl transferase/acyl carrier protein